MAKTATRKKPTQTKTEKRLAGDKKKKLPRGYKECGNCKMLLNIHKYVCNQCGHKHDMKKKKVDILKNLNKVTPKLLRSLIELNDFNDINQFWTEPSQFAPSITLKEDILIPPSQYKKRRSSKAQQNNNIAANTMLQKENHCFYIKVGTNLSSICSINEDIVVAQTIQKWGQFNESQKITMRAYDLQKFHKMGQIYKGKTLLSIFSQKKLSYRVIINQHIVSMKSVSNRVAALTGKGNIIIFSLPMKSQSSNFDRSIELTNFLTIQIGEEDQITVFQWLKCQNTQERSRILIGTLMGHMHLFDIEENKVKIIRYFANAHFQAITALAECPLGNNQQCLFASGSFDGCLSIWSVNDCNCLYKVEASNRKISNLVWDSGAKFIFVVRDQNQDSCVLACFFAILKSQESVALSDQIDFRLIRTSANCKALHDPRSNQFSLIDPYESTLRVFPIQELRKNSLKRKKVKREDEQKIYKLSFEGHENKEDLSEDQPKMNQKYLPLPIIADACQNRVEGVDCVWGVTYNGHLFLIQITQ